MPLNTDRPINRATGVGWLFKLRPTIWNYRGRQNQLPRADRANRISVSGDRRGDAV